MKKNIHYLHILFFLKLFSPIIYSQNSNKDFKDANEAWNRYESQRKAYQELESKKMEELIQAGEDNNKTGNEKEYKKRKKNSKLQKEDEYSFAKSRAVYREIMQSGVTGVGGNTIDISTEDLTIAQELFGQGTGVDAGIRHRVEEFKKGTVYQRRLLLNNISPIKINSNKKFDLGNPINNVFKLLNQIYNSIFS